MRRTWVKANHRIHTEAIRENIVPLIHHHTKREGLYFASEVDMLNKVVFGMTAKEWRMANTDKKGNMRDQASVEQLVVLANMENLNADYISMGLSREERYTRLTTISAHQLSVFAGNSAIKALKKLYKKK